MGLALMRGIRLHPLKDGLHLAGGVYPDAPGKE